MDTPHQTPKMDQVPTTPTTPQPSVGDVQFLFHVLKNVKGKLDVNWEGVATAMNLKNVNVAKVRFGQIKRKLNWDSLDQGDASAGPGTGSPQTPIKKSRVRGPKKPEDPNTPTKKRKTASGEPGKVLRSGQGQNYVPSILKMEEDDSGFHPDIYSDAEN